MTRVNLGFSLFFSLIVLVINIKILRRYVNTLSSFILRKHAYSNILRILPPKTENFQMKNSGSFHISAKKIDCVYSLEPPHRGGSNEYPQSMFLSRNKKNKVYTCKPQFYYIKWGLKGSKLYRHVFVMSLIRTLVRLQN